MNDFSFKNLFFCLFIVIALAILLVEGKGLSILFLYCIKPVKFYFISCLVGLYCNVSHYNQKRRLSTGGLPRSHVWEIYGQCTKFPRLTKISQVLIFHFTTPTPTPWLHLTEAHLEHGWTSTMEFFLRKYLTVLSC